MADEICSLHCIFLFILDNSSGLMLSLCSSSCNLKSTKIRPTWQSQNLARTQDQDRSKESKDVKKQEVQTLNQSLPNQCCCVFFSNDYSVQQYLIHLLRLCMNNVEKFEPSLNPRRHGLFLNRRLEGRCPQ